MRPNPLAQQPVRITIDINPAGKVSVTCNQQITQLGLMQVLTALLTDNVASMVKAASMIINPNPGPMQTPNVGHIKNPCTDAFHDFMQYGATCPTCKVTNPPQPNGGQ